MDLLNIIEANWPHLLTPYTLNVLDISPVLTPEQTLEMRKSGIMVMQKLSSGRILSSIGGGITTAKTSVRAMTEAQGLARLIHHAEDQVQAKESEIRTKLKATSGQRIKLLELSQEEAMVACAETKIKTKVSL